MFRMVNIKLLVTSTVCQRACANIKCHSVRVSGHNRDIVDIVKVKYSKFSNQSHPITKTFWSISRARPNHEQRPGHKQGTGPRALPQSRVQVSAPEQAATAGRNSRLGSPARWVAAGPEDDLNLKLLCVRQQCLAILTFVTTYHKNKHSDKTSQGDT